MKNLLPTFSKLFSKENKLSNAPSKLSFFAPTISDLFGKQNTRLPDPANHQYERYVNAYADQAWVYACVSAIVNTLSDLEFVIRNEKGVIVENHPALNLLYTPNSFMTIRQLFNYLSGGLELTGNAYLLKDNLTAGRPTTLFPLMPQYIKIKPSGDPENPIKEFQYNINGTKKHYLSEDVIHFKFYNAADFYYGLAPLAAARTPADTLQASEKYNEAFFNNSARPDGILSSDNRVDEPSKNRMLKMWNDKFRGEEKAHKTVVLSDGVKWQQMGMSQKDMEYIQGQKLSRETVCAIFGVPPAMVGLFEFAPQFNTKEQQKIFYQNTIIPKAKVIAETLTEFLLPAFDNTKKHYFSIDLSNINVLREDITEKAPSATLYQKMGFTRNEVTVALGLPFPITKDGDIRHEPDYIITSPTGILNAPKADSKLFTMGSKRLSRVQVTQYMNERDALLAIHGRKMKKVAANHFNDQLKKIKSYIKRTKEIPKSYSTVFDKKVEYNKFTAEQKPELRNSIDTGLDHERDFIDKILKRERRYYGISIKATDRVQKWINQNSLKWAKEIENTTLERLDVLLDTELKSGHSVAETASVIDDYYGGMAKGRAGVVAATEIHSALTESTMEAYAEEPVIDGKGWISTDDDATRDSHRTAGIRYGEGGEFVKKDGLFQVGAGSGQAPGQIGLAAEDIECRCGTFPKFKE